MRLWALVFNVDFWPDQLDTTIGFRNIRLSTITGFYCNFNYFISDINLRLLAIV